ncbi:hypothetical protein JI666_09335 [Bacillus sp. NTK071]|uniref:hypothetical protein n=1 Tax=Bacillales TaxID=1385 RepID=UPI00146F3653|nr:MULTISPECIES: hypothetical protein [Bacillaceae]MBN8208947.1 hypothetical protein [Bacillus sp. NTK071]
MNSQSENFDDEKKEKAKEAVKSFVVSNYKDIDTVEITKLHQSEMGGLNIEGTVNHGRAQFKAGVRNDFSIGNLSVGDEFPDIKEECKERLCAY